MLVGEHSTNGAHDRHSMAVIGEFTVDSDQFILGDVLALDPDGVGTDQARQYDGVNSTNTGMISMRPIHMRNVIASLVDRGKGA